MFFLVGKISHYFVEFTSSLEIPTEMLDDMIE